MRTKHGIHIRITYQTRQKIQRHTAHFVTSDYQNYELGSVTMLLKDLSWKSLTNRREGDRLCLLKKGLDNNAILCLYELSRPAETSSLLLLLVWVARSKIPKILESFFIIVVNFWVVLRIRDERQSWKRHHEKIFICTQACVNKEFVHSGSIGLT